MTTYPESATAVAFVPRKEFAEDVMFPLVAIPLTEDIRRQRERLVRAALRHADLSMQQAAGEAEMNQGHFTRLVQGVEGGLRKVYQQPDRFWQWLGVVIAAEVGIPREARRAVLLRRVSMTHKARARMSLRKVKRSA